MNFTPQMIEEVVANVRRGNADMVSNAISQGLSPNTLSDEGRTLLCEAVLGRHLNMTSQLLLCGADPLLSNIDGMNAIECAELIGDNRILTLLKKHQTDKNKIKAKQSVSKSKQIEEDNEHKDDGTTQLILEAARSCNFHDIVNAYFLRANLDIKDENGEYLADIVKNTKKASAEIAYRWLLRRGAPSKYFPGKGRPIDSGALFSFARQGNIKEIFRGIVLGNSINCRDRQGNTLLMVAAETKNAQLIEELCYWGASFRPKNEKFQDVFAIANLNSGYCGESIWQTLTNNLISRKREAKTTKTIPDIVLAAATSGNLELIQEYLSYKMNPGIASEDGISLINYADLAHEQAIVKTLQDLSVVEIDADTADDHQASSVKNKNLDISLNDDDLFDVNIGLSKEAIDSILTPRDNSNESTSTTIVKNKYEEKSSDDVIEDSKVVNRRGYVTHHKNKVLSASLPELSIDFEDDINLEDDDDLIFDLDNKEAPTQSDVKNVAVDNLNVLGELRESSNDELKFIRPVAKLNDGLRTQLYALAGLVPSTLELFLKIQECSTKTEANMICDGQLAEHWEFFRMLKLYCDDLTRS